MDNAYAAVGLLDNLRDAIRSPEDTPARQEYINYLLARADVLLSNIAKGRVNAV